MPLPLSTGVGPTQGTITDGALFTKLIDEGGAKLAQLTGTQALNRSGLLIQGLNDNVGRTLRTDRMGNLSSSAWALQFWDDFEGSGLHVQRWTTTTTTFAVAQSQAQVLLNSGASVAANSGAVMLGTSYVPKQLRTPMFFRSRLRYQSTNNGAAAFGVTGLTTAIITSQQTNGIYFMDTAGGALVPTIAYQGTYISGSNITGLLSTGYYTYEIDITDDDVTFTVLDTQTEAVINEQILRLPRGQGRLQSESHYAPFFQVFSSASVPTSAPQVWVSDVVLGTIEQSLGRSAQVQAASLGRSALYHPQSGIVQTGNNTLNTAYPSLTLSPSATLVPGISGVFTFPAVAGAVTDYLVLAVVTPARSRFVVTGVDIQMVNQGAAVGTTPTTLVWSMVAGAPASTLGTGVARKALGIQSLAVGAAVGQQAQGISRQFGAPLYVEANKFLQLVIRVPVGTATAGQLLMGTIDVEGYYE